MADKKMSAVSPESSLEVIRSLQVENRSLRSENDALKNDVESLKSGIDQVTISLENARVEAARFRREAEELAKKVPSAKEEKEGMVEVVAVPDNGPDGKPGFIPGDKSKGGRVYRATYDGDGFAHYWVPLDYARSLVSESSGLRHVFVGPDELFEIKASVQKGMYRNVVSIPRHSKKQTRRGVEFVPVEVEVAK